MGFKVDVILPNVAEGAGLKPFPSRDYRLIRNTCRRSENGHAQLGIHVLFARQLLSDVVEQRVIAEPCRIDPGRRKGSYVGQYPLAGRVYSVRDHFPENYNSRNRSLAVLYVHRTRRQGLQYAPKSVSANDCLSGGSFAAHGSAGDAMGRARPGHAPSSTG